MTDTLLFSQPSCGLSLKLSYAYLGRIESSKPFAAGNVSDE